MIERGYNKNVYGLLAAGGTLILIPTTNEVYGFITEESVISLFLAGIGDFSYFFS